ncbi:DUF2946 domain-containing protein [Pandoraea sp. NPDC087047]|uniref:DUF2946 domain-containing protein n=1 Tax=Pandoraea sp. NPDC087047 TaxID=3364390 RepID=UPI003812DF42
MTITKRNQKRLAVWLGLVAMWLVVVAPLVSSSLMTQRWDTPHGTLCSAASQFESHDTAEHRQHVAHGDACCYCHFLEHHAVVLGMPLPGIYLACIVVVLAVTTFALRFIPIGAFPSGRPRAPPFAF